MPVSVVVGGQFGSEGKGKVSAFLAKDPSVAAIVRVGGPNSGHTAIDAEENVRSFRQLPAGMVQSKADIVLPAGSLIDVEILLHELEHNFLARSRLKIDARASIVTTNHREVEAASGIVKKIGSTGSGTGASLSSRISRSKDHMRAGDVEALQPFLMDNTASYLRRLLDTDKRVLIEGTQGYGLSLWHSPSYPYCTSRDTTAASFVSEAGLAPHDVNEVVMVLRAFPIRVGGNSGPLENETSWAQLSSQSRIPDGFMEFTTATNRVRRVAFFDPEIVIDAIAVNAPHKIVLNHMDYIDPQAIASGPTQASIDFVKYVESRLNREVDYLGYGPSSMVKKQLIFQKRCA